MAATPSPILGSDVKRVRFRLTPGADFYCIVEYTVDEVVTPFPVGMQVEIRWPGLPSQVWVATIVGSQATFLEQEVDVQAVIDAGLEKGQLWQVTGTLDQLWASGPVILVD